MSEPITSYDPYTRIVEAFDKNATANRFLAEDGDGGFAAGVHRMAEEIDRLRTENERLRNDNHILHGEITNDMNLTISALRARVAELEADVTAMQKGLAFEKRNNALLGARTIERCAQVADDHGKEFPHTVYVTHYIADAIRALKRTGDK